MVVQTFRFAAATERAWRVFTRSREQQPSSDFETLVFSAFSKAERGVGVDALSKLRGSSG